MMLEFDADKDGDLNFQEFVNMMHRLTSGPTEKDVRRAMFELFDENMDGYISFLELLAGWRKAAAETNGAVEVPTEEAIKALMAEADTDGDGQLNEQEFLSVVEACS